LKWMGDPEINVLLVDDEPEFAELVHFFLGKQNGITVHSTNTAKKALEMIDTTEYDAVVSDYMMPEINGIDFLKILRAKGSSIPFILLTGRGREDIAVQALNLGADFYVAKHGDQKAIFVELSNAITQCVEKKAALESLKASERKYRELVELAQEGIWAIDSEGRTTLVNAKMAQMLGYNPDEMMGELFFDFMDSSWREKAAEYFDRRMKGVSEHHEFEFMKKDGTVLQALVGASAARDDDGKVIGGVAVISDMSDRARSAALLKEERDVAQNYLDIAGAIILCMDTDGHVTLVNKRGCEILGYSKEEIVGKDWFSTFLPEGMRSEIGEIFDGVLSEEITAETAVMSPVLTKSGEERIVRWHNTVIRDEAGQVTQTLSSGEDVTDAFRMEQEFQKELEVANALAELSSMLISPDMSIPELSKLILRYVLTLTGSEHGFVSSIDPVTRSNVCHTLTEMVEGGACRVENRDTDIEFPIGADGRYPSLWGVALNRREPFYTNAPAEHESSCGIPDGHIPLKNFLSVPVTFGNDLVGEICAANSSRGYSDKDVLIASRLGGLFTVALRRQRDIESFVDVQNRFKSFMDHSSTISFIKDLRGRYAFANREYELMLGLSSDDIIGKTDLELWPEGAAKSFREADERVTSSGIAERYSEAVELPDGVHEYLTFKFPLFDSKGEIALLGGVSVDVTDMKKRESALELANEKLRILGSLTRHDAINQITVLEAWLSLLKEDEDCVGFRNPLETMTVATKTLRKQLEFAAELELVGSGDQTWVDIQEVCANVWDEMAIEGIVLECRCSGFEALVDPLFPNVIRNLADNTVRHGEGAKRVSILCQETPDGLRLVYEDDGVGVTSEAKGKIFDKGFGANTGFGLYLARELLKLSDARISEVGEHGKGVRFEIDFPGGRCRRKTAN
jgi:PAS domain S-box-containing protein